MFSGRQCKNVSYKFSEPLNRIYLELTKKKKDCDEVEEIVVPTLAFDQLNLKEIERIQSILCINKEKSEITIALIDSTSTILYYKMTNSFVDI